MAEIDSLELKIIADATSASASIDRFVASLERLSVAMAGIQNANGLDQVATGISNLGVAMEGVANIDSRKFSTLANNINRLGAIGGSQLSAAANGMFDLIVALDSVNGTAPETAVNVANIANAVGRLGSANIERAVTNIPRLAIALKDMLTSLSTAPEVSQNVIEMTNALANLAMQTRGMQPATNNVGNAFTNLAHRARKSTHSLRGLASSFGMFYAKFFLLIRGIKKLWASTESAMDYVETFNYYSVALDKVGKTTARAFGEMGENDAEAYTEKFTEKLKELNKKMTGYIVGDNGELINTDSIGLGLDPEKLMNFQAQILGITNSVGLLGDASTSTAKALSMLSADLSSLTNTDLEQVMNNLRSGLIGQSRALYKYGIDVTSATLKQYALAYGIQKSVTEMSQSEKMQLRMLAILDQSRIAWGDQARTINTVANQYRILKQQVSNLGRIIGNLFLPIIQKVLPYINAFIIVLQRLFTMLGFKLWGDSWLKDLNQDITSIGGGADDIDGLSDSLDDAADSAKKLKGQLLGIDELNVLNTKENGADSKLGGLGGIDLSDAIADALAEYESAWDEALKNAKNKSEEIANAIENAIRNLSPYEIGRWFAEKFNDIDWRKLFVNTGEKIAKALNTAVQFALGVGENIDFKGFGEAIGRGVNKFFSDADFASAGKAINVWVTGLLDAVIAVIDTTDFSLIGQRIGEFLEGLDWHKILNKVGELIWKALGAVIDLWKGSFDAAPLETAVVTAIALLKFSGITAATFANLGSAIETGAGSALATTAGAIATSFATYLNAALIAIAAAPIAEEIGLNIVDLLIPDDSQYQAAVDHLKEHGLFGTYEDIFKGSTGYTTDQFEWAMQKVSEGIVFTDEQLREMQKEYNLTQEDLESLRQATLDYNPVLRELADTFPELSDSSAQTLKQIADGLDLIKEGASGVNTAFDDFSEKQFHLTDDASAFFLSLQTSAQDTGKVIEDNLGVPFEEIDGILAETLDDWEIDFNSRLKQFHDTAESMGENVSTGYWNGLGKETRDMNKAYRLYTDDLQDEIESEWDMHSPSKVAEGYGLNITKGLANGIIGNSNAILNAVNGITDIAIRAFDSVTSVFETIGANIATGVANGIYDGIDNIENSSKYMAKTVKDTVKQELEIHSPSRVMFKLGEQTIEGFNLGMEKLLGDTEKVMTTFTGEITKAPKVSYNVPKVDTESVKQSNVSSSLYPLIYNAVSSAMGGSETTVNVVLEGDTDKIFKVVKDKSVDFTRRTGLPAFS